MEPEQHITMNPLSQIHHVRTKLYLTEDEEKKIRDKLVRKLALNA
jgi:hypothetical protein